MDQWLEFYGPFFPTPADAREFVSRRETAADPSVARVVMHQVQRLVTLSDEVRNLRKRDSLGVLFLVICAECVAKLQAGFHGEGQSRFYLRQFFSKFLGQEDTKVLSLAFVRLPDMECLTATEAVDLLYEIRCDVVHEGQYWNFFFSEPGLPMVNSPSRIMARITYNELREITTRAGIQAGEATL